MRRSLYLLSIFYILAITSCRNANPRVVEDFNFGWTFCLGDSTTYSSPNYDDTDWRKLHLPHDWSIEGEFDEANPSTFSGGALTGGIGWYRKHFELKLEADSRYFIEFDGVYMNSSVFLNGQLIGNRPYGYSSFCYELSDFLKNGDNVIAVRCDNAQQPNSRWYAGCGIYRNVKLVRTGLAQVQYDGLYVRTSRDTVFVQAKISGNAERVHFKFTSPSGSECGSAEGQMSDNGIWEGSYQIKKPELWKIDSPALYKVTVDVYENGRLSDRYCQTFGFRTISWDPDEGFFLNGEHIKLHGVCLHHDLGCIGSAFYPRAMEKRLDKLKEMGCNAIRTSHNPPAPEFLDMCDRLGFLVIDEALDMWRLPKTKYDYSQYFEQWHETDIRDMVCRDRNHPCIILWSAGNEIPEQFRLQDEAENIALSRHIVSLFKTEDPTRGVTIGLDWPDTSNVLIKSGAFDVLGFNYRSESYDNMKEEYKNTPLIGSEIASALESRGWYPQPSDLISKRQKTEDAEIHQCPSYDNSCAVWSEIHSKAWLEIKRRDYMAGGFVWTGYDYLGEPTPFGWPSRSSYFGILDLAGFPKDIYYMYKSEWTGKDVLHLFPHWNWKQGDSVDVWCYYNNADEVELLVNGKSLGRSSKAGDKLHAEWLKVPYEAGEIVAIAYRNGTKVNETRRVTSGEAKTLKLSADKNRLQADGYDLCYVTVTALDAEGNEVPTADDLLRFSVSGAGELFGVDNGNSADTLCLKGQVKALFSGKAIAVIRSVKDRTGSATLTVTSQYDTKQITIKSR